MDSDTQQEQVRAIWRDSALSPLQRQSAIQNIMNPTVPSVEESTHVPPSIEFSEGVRGCKHYARNCHLVAPCCQKQYGCRWCHTEEESHKMDRFKVRAMVCLFCDKRQPVRKSCRYCKRDMADYYCDICHLFDNTSDKPIYHCHKCGSCRRGEEENTRHCEVCVSCIPKDAFDNHTCYENAMLQNCPVCLQSLIESVNPVTTIKCGHLLHAKCLSNMQVEGQWRCCVCQRSMYPSDVMALFWDRIDLEVGCNPTPDEYKKHVGIYCRDCDLKSEDIEFSFVALRCPKCKGYNTSITALLL